MLVEDDNNLREIYEARLLAEGYEIVSAEDGEQALALAVKEKPDLIISDVMMPKISGFDMLDILRSTPETRNTKVIMMTALSQAEDKARADKLGADRYLVKSQVTLEDVAKVAREVLQDEDTVPAAAAVGAQSTAPVPGPASTPPAVTPTPVAAEPPVQTQTPVVPAPPVIPPVQPPAEPPASPAPPPAAPDPGQQTVTPAGDPGGSSQVEPPKVPPTTPQPTVSLPAVDPAQMQTTAAETANIEKQITDFVQNMPRPNPAAPALPAPVSSPPSTPRPPVMPITPEPPASSTDSTNVAAGSAATMANTVNNLLQKSAQAAAPAADSTPDTPRLAVPHSNQISGKKVITPLNDLSAKSGPDLNELLAKEMAGTTAPSPQLQPVSQIPLPTQPMPAPMPSPVTPQAPGTDEEVDIKPPGNVVQPGGQDPNSIAL